MDRSSSEVQETMDVPVLVGFTVVQSISQIVMAVSSWRMGRADVSPCKKTLRIDEKVESLDILRSERLIPKSTTVRQCALWTTWLLKIVLLLLVLLVLAMVVDSKDIITNPCSFLFASETNISTCVSDYAEETYVGCGSMSTTPVVSLGESTRGVKELQEATLEAVAVDKERKESLRKLLQQLNHRITTLLIEETIRENVVLNATYVTKTAAVKCTVDCGGGVMPIAPVASSGEFTRGVEESQEATFEAVAVYVSDEKERKVSLGKLLQQPINMTTTLMIEEAPCETAMLNASDLDKNTSACTETMGLCLLYMNMFEPDVAVNASKSNSSYGGKAGGDCILDTCTTRGRESSISRFTNLGNITLLAHRRDSSIGCLKKLGNITLLARRRDLKTRLATLKDRIRNVKCKSKPQMKQTNGLLQKNLSDMNIRRRNNTLKATGSDRLTNVMRNILYNKSAGFVKGVKCENESHRKLLLVHLVCQRAIRRIKSLNELILEYSRHYINFEPHKPFKSNGKTNKCFSGFDAAAQQASVEDFLKNLTFQFVGNEVFKCIKVSVGLFATGCFVLVMCFVIPWVDLHIHSLLVYRRWYWYDIRERRRWWKKKNEKAPSFKIGRSYGLMRMPVKWVLSLFIAASELGVGADAYAQLPNNLSQLKAAVNSLNADGSGTHPTYGPMKDWDMSLVTDISYLFYYKETMNADLSSWDVSRVTTLYGTFERASVFNSDLSKWAVTSVTTMKYTFNGASLFNSDISKWAVTSVTDMNQIFYNSGFKRTLCGSKWDPVNGIPGSKTGNKNAFDSLGSSTARYGCCPANTYMSSPEVNSLKTGCDSRDEAETTIKNMYINLLCRDPELSGFKSWTKRCQSGGSSTVDDIQTSFRDSQEAQKRYLLRAGVACAAEKESGWIKSFFDGTGKKKLPPTVCKTKCQETTGCKFYSTRDVTGCMLYSSCDNPRSDVGYGAYNTYQIMILNTCFVKENSCSPCPAGTFTSVPNDEISCQLCPRGKSSTAGSKSCDLTTSKLPNGNSEHGDGPDGTRGAGAAKRVGSLGGIIDDYLYLAQKCWTSEIQDRAGSSNSWTKVTSSPNGCNNLADRVATSNSVTLDACETLCGNTQGCKYAEYWPDKSCDMYSACNFARTSFPGDVYDLSPGVFSFATSSAVQAYCEKTTNCLGYSLAPSTQGGKYWVYKHTTLLIRTGWKSWKVKSTCFSKRAAVTKTYGPIENWDVSAVTNMKYAFWEQRTFNEIISSWDTSSVTDMYASTFKYIPLYKCSSKEKFNILTFLFSLFSFSISRFLIII